MQVSSAITYDVGVHPKVDANAQHYISVVLMLALLSVLAWTLDIVVDGLGPNFDFS